MKVAAVLLLAVWSAVAGELRYKPAPALNPLKGLIAHAGAPRSDFPFALAYVEFPLSAFEGGFDRFERRLAAIANDGRHAVVRVHSHWPGRNETPDYSDPAVQRGITNFIAEFGTKYDGDARIGFIEAGLLGEWGEWIERKKGAIPESLKIDVLAAYATAFKVTKILARWPSELTAGKGFGYHDDWFGHTTQFAELMKTFNVGQGEPIGGRIHPRFGDCLWSEEKRCGPTDEEVFNVVKRGGYSYLRLPSSIKGGEERALNWSRALGYELQVTRAEIRGSGSNQLSVLVTMTNRGAAPFYYRWPVELMVYRKYDYYGRLKTDWDIRTVVAGREVKFGHVEAGEASRRSKILMRVVNPMKNGIPLRFANEEQDADEVGWLTLGEVTRE